MKTFFTLFKKEWLEAWRDKKLIWLPIVMLVLAVSQPLALYYMSDLLEGAGNLPEGAVIEIPVPSGEEVLVSTLSQFNLIGTAIIVLSVMGVISHERNSGALSLIMARPVEPSEYIVSKWFAHMLILVLSFGISYALAYYYTVLLFDDVSFVRWFASFAIYSLWIVFVMSATLLFGTILKKAGGIAGASLVFVAGLSLVTTLFPKFMQWSPTYAFSEANQFLMTGDWGETFYPVVVTSSILIIGLVLLSTFLFKRFESYTG